MSRIAEMRDADADAFWARAEGEEYDLLRLLPAADAHRVWKVACDAFWRALQARWWFPLFMTIVVPLGLMATGSVVWTVAQALGAGFFGRFVLELVFHAALACVLHRPLHRLFVARVRPFLRDELLRFADERTAPAAGTTD